MALRLVLAETLKFSMSGGLVCYKSLLLGGERVLVRCIGDGLL